MKTLVLSILVLLLSIHSIIAQSIININKTSNNRYKEINITKSIASNFNEAKRLRELVLNQNIQNIELIHVKDTILLDLFNDKLYKACVDKIDIDVNGTSTIRAKLANYDYSYCMISTYNGKSFMTIEIPENNELYMSKYNHQTNKYYLLQIDKPRQKVLEGASPLIPPTDNNSNKNSKKNQGKTNVPNSKSSKNIIVNEENTINNPILQESSQKNQDTITLMIAYTPAAATWSSSNETSINNTISLLMAKAQLALDNSNTQITLKLVLSVQVNYTELNNSNDLNNLTNNGDGILDTIHILRNAYCADVVVLIENISFTGGLGWLLNTYSGSPSYAFSLTRVQQASWTYTTIHEIGHNMGCHHHIAQNVQPGPGLDSYSAGWRWDGNGGVKYCSVMTYEGGIYFADSIPATRVAYFSNPSIQYQGIPTGHIDSADNARTLRQVKAVVAAYRTGCTCTPPTLQATSFTSSALANNSMTIGWTRGNGNSVLVVARDGSAVNTDPTDGTAYTANTAYSSGTQIGSGNYVVYKGTGNTVNITALASGTTYYYAIYEYDTIENCYKMPALTGNATTTGISPYCTAGSPATTYEYISNVAMGSINQASGRGTAGYQDYTSQTTTMQIGVNTTATITVTDSYTTDQILIWIDWNKNGDFTDAGENVYSSSGSSFSSPHTTTSFAAPVGAALGTTRMRIRLHDANSGGNTTPCGNSDYGEVEDYTINVTSVTCTPPTTQATLFTSSAITNNSMNIGWTRGNGDSVLVVAKAGSAINTDPTNGSLYTANSIFGNGSQIDTDNYVVYKGIGTSVNITGLVVGTTYYYAIYEYNDTAYCYKTPALVGNATTFCTPVSIATQPTITQTRCTPSNSASFTVIANGTTPITYQWQYNNGSTWTNVTNGTPTGAIYTNGTTATMSVSGITAAATHQYRCYLTNCSGTNIDSSNTASLIVNATPSVNAISSQTICSGESTILVTPTSTPTGATYTWTANATTGISGHTTSGTGTIPVQTISTTALTAGNVTYTITPTLNSCIGNTNTFVVNINPKPVIADQTTTIASGTMFNVTPTGVPSGTSYTWTIPSYTNGVTGGSAQTTGVTNISQTLIAPTSTGTATYTVTPTSGNCTGNTFIIIVTVNYICTPVNVTTQPTVTQTRCTPSSNASFTVAANGTTPITYQWEYNNSGIWTNVINGTPTGAIYTNGTAATMSVTGITAAATYQYRCYLTNCSGTNIDSSNIASLVVNATPSTPIITQTGNTLTSDASTGNQWYNLTTGIINGANAQSYNPIQIGNYFTIVTINGCQSDSSNIIYYNNTGIDENNVNPFNIKIFPNPFTDKTTIEYTLVENENVELMLVDITGQELIKLVNKKQSKGTQTTVIDASKFSKGIYFYKLKIEDTQQIGKLIKY